MAGIGKVALARAFYKTTQRAQLRVLMRKPEHHKVLVASECSEY